jgi:hypothetical protein
VCDEHGICGGGEYCGNSDAQLDRINVFYHEASGGRRVRSPRGAHEIVPRVIGTLALSRRSASSSARATL